MPFEHKRAHRGGEYKVNEQGSTGRIKVLWATNRSGKVGRACPGWMRLGDASHRASRTKMVAHVPVNSASPRSERAGLCASQVTMLVHSMGQTHEIPPFRAPARVAVPGRCIEREKNGCAWDRQLWLCPGDESLGQKFTWPGKAWLCASQVTMLVHSMGQTHEIPPFKAPARVAVPGRCIEREKNGCAWDRQLWLCPGDESLGQKFTWPGKAWLCLGDASAGRYMWLDACRALDGCAWAMHRPGALWGVPRTISAVGRLSGAKRARMDVWWASMGVSGRLLGVVGLLLGVPRRWLGVSGRLLGVPVTLHGRGLG